MEFILFMKSSVQSLRRVQFKVFLNLIWSSLLCSFKKDLCYNIFKRKNWNKYFLPINYGADRICPFSTLHPVNSIPFVLKPIYIECALKLFANVWKQVVTYRPSKAFTNFVCRLLFTLAAQYQQREASNTNLFDVCL